MTSVHSGFEGLGAYPIFDALWNRRSRRISEGIATVRAGSSTYTPNPVPKTQPLDELEEAILIAATGATGFTLPDRPCQSPQGDDILGTPNLNFWGRTAGSTKNSRPTYFILFNDSGSYFLKRLEKVDPVEPFTPEVLIERARQCKYKIADTRPTFPRGFPYYLDSNRFLSNVEMPRQYINALMHLLTEPDGHRPTFVDARNFYRLAGVRKWVRNGFLN